MQARFLKCKTTIPFNLEQRLVNHWGYAIEKRNFLQGDNSYILFRKVSPKLDKPIAQDDGVKRTIRASVNDNVIKLDPKLRELESGLTKWQRQQLDKRCDNIVMFFPDPYSVPKAVRARLHIIQQRMTPAEIAHVDHYIEENFPV